VPHHGLDIADPSQAFSVAEYLAYAENVAQKVFAQGRRLLVTGGSGFYLKSFYAPVVDDWEITPELRAEVESLETREGLPGLVTALRERHPQGTPPIDLHNPRRVKNALLRCLASGRDLHQLKAAFQQRGTPFDHYQRRYCLLMRDQDDLEQRIEQRARQMVEQGLIAETQKLLDQNITQNPAASSAIGYRETIHYLQTNQNNPAKLIQEIALHTRQLLKKQLSWFRKQFPANHILWIAPEKTADIREAFGVDC
jgi:tRNA dimethylallyltransferase